ncbi:carbohydrate-binding module family 20 protein [Hydnum rufescens UP504]|uniref:glucan 1,4-alpha-glucosidase n=1 Tax=Hydnum rufescens UP504 TaxID=1448309 RepID=A0A9P6DY75_9AGAM|nr:carbohydrate-binding module family 20 protein [Hydnum rufescens UP504]
MRFALSFFFLAKVCLADVASYISMEGPIAKAGVLANIGTKGAKPGIVIASPSTIDPDYLYTWTRDSSLVFKLLIDQYTRRIDTTLLNQITDFITAEGILQGVSNPSGSVGEPKFNVDETAFTGPWGRPQRDGPALRATAMMTFANYLISSGNISYPANTIWPMVKIDLDYVSANWNNTGFDLWEEVDGSSFFTIAVQHRALREGATFATLQGDNTRAATYNTQAANLLCFLQGFWSSSSSALIANINVNNGRGGLDANTILGSIHTFDPAAGPDAITFQPGSDKALLNHYTTVNSFRGSLYTINSHIAAGQAVNIGRYKEDVYYNGNPWYLATFAAAEQLYLAIYQWEQAGQINVTSTSLPFFTQLVSSTTVQNYPSNTPGYRTLISAVFSYADGFLELAKEYTPSSGRLSEQYLKSNGTQTSAVDLTWSYASALTAFFARNGTILGNAWGAKGLTTPCGPGATVSITFLETATTMSGESIYITGSIDALQNWSTSTALPLSSTKYPVWSITLDVPASTTFQYKYIRIRNGVVTWESDPNRSLTSPASGTYTERDTWR